jgi:hypothetical protein
MQPGHLLAFTPSAGLTVKMIRCGQAGVRVLPKGQASEEFADLADGSSLHLVVKTHRDGSVVATCTKT